MTDWQPGDVALCVDDHDPAPGFGHWPLIVAGQTYTVLQPVLSRVVAYGPRGITERGALALRLLELRNPCDVDDAFDARRFIKQPSLVIESEEKQEEPVE